MRAPADARLNFVISYADFSQFIPCLNMKINTNKQTHSCKLPTTPRILSRASDNSNLHANSRGEFVGAQENQNPMSHVLIKIIKDPRMLPWKYWHFWFHLEILCYTDECLWYMAKLSSNSHMHIRQFTRLNNCMWEAYTLLSISIHISNFSIF